MIQCKLMDLGIFMQEPSLLPKIVGSTHDSNTWSYRLMRLCKLIEKKHKELVIDALNVERERMLEEIAPMDAAGKRPTRKEKMPNPMNHKMEEIDVLDISKEQEDKCNVELRKFQEELLKKDVELDREPIPIWFLVETKKVEFTPRELGALEPFCVEVEKPEAKLSLVGERKNDSPVNVS